jgi:hypothetical protein
MSLRSLQRRVNTLEARIGRAAETSPLSPLEIESILQRIERCQALCTEEEQRIEQHGHVVGRNMIISVHRGTIQVKRYLGVDMDDI